MPYMLLFVGHDDEFFRGGDRTHAAVKLYELRRDEQELFDANEEGLEV